MNIEKIVEKIYSETDIGKSIATALSSTIGLTIYLLTKNTIIALFSLIIIFPIIRIITSSIHLKIKEKQLEKSELQKKSKYIENFTKEEQIVIKAFISYGGASMSWSTLNRLELPTAGVESLVQRQILFSTMTADGMREAFALDTDFFDIAKLYFEKIE